MYTIENENIYAFDIDKTLISNRRFASDSSKAYCELEIKNPYTGISNYADPHIGHVDLLKEMHGRGRYIVVWSAAGVLWAKAVIESLGLEKYVDLVQTKPIGYVDDQVVTEWLSNRIYLEPKDRT